MASNTSYGLDFFLGEEIDMLRDSVRRFADAEIAPIAAEIDKTNAFPAPSGASSASSASSASPSRRSTAAPAWATSPM